MQLLPFDECFGLFFPPVQYGENLTFVCFFNAAAVKGLIYTYKPKVEAIIFFMLNMVAYIKGGRRKVTERTEGKKR